jgi:uncharacterized protein YbbK (DUF523 family)
MAIVISSCLAGKKCRYNGSGSLNQPLLDSINEQYIDLCPELLGGFAVPRLPCEIINCDGDGGGGKDVLAGKAKIIDIDGNDVTAKLLAGAQRALDICLRSKITKAYLKQNSPSCGCGKIYDGSFSSVLKNGNGIFTELLLSNGIDVVGV